MKYEVIVDGDFVYLVASDGEGVVRYLLDDLESESLLSLLKLIEVSCFSRSSN